jgi:type I restriction enzyme S subunit
VSGSRTLRIAELATNVFDGPFGSNLKSSDYTGSGTRVIRLENIGHRHFIGEKETFISDDKAEGLARHRLLPSDILFSSFVEDAVRVCLFPAGLPTPAINKADCFCIRVNSNLALPEFVALQLASRETFEVMRDLVHGATRPRVGLDALKNYRVEVPPLAQQRRIVARIEALFARIRRARVDLERVAPLSDRHRLASLRAGVTGQLTEAWRQGRPVEDVQIALRQIPAPEQGRGGREATTDVTPGMAALSVNDPGTLAPAGWAWTPLLRVARQETGHTPSRRVSAYWDGGDVPWIGIRDAGAHHGTTIYDTIQKCTELGLANSSARLLPAGTVCLSRTASVGYVTVLGKSMATSQDFATWTCTPALLPEYLKFALLAEGDDIRRFGEGSTHTTIYFPEIRALHICLPPIEEQVEIVRILTSNAGGQTIASIEAARTLALLNRLEQSILARAFRGKFVAQEDDDSSDDRSAKNAPSSRISRKLRRTGRAAT